MIPTPTSTSTPLSARTPSSAARKVFSADVSETRTRIQTGLGKWAIRSNTLIIHTAGLDEILLEAKKIPTGTVRMNYTNYELKIVERYGVHLANWNTNDGKVINPGDLRRDQLTEVLRDLRDGDCHWTSLSKEELLARIARNRERQANGEVVYTERKKRKRPEDDEGEARVIPAVSQQEILIPSDVHGEDDEGATIPPNGI